MSAINAFMNTYILFPCIVCLGSAPKKHRTITYENID